MTRESNALLSSRLRQLRIMKASFSSVVVDLNVAPTAWQLSASLSSLSLPLQTPKAWINSTPPSRSAEAMILKPAPGSNGKPGMPGPSPENTTRVWLNRGFLKVLKSQSVLSKNAHAVENSWERRVEARRVDSLHCPSGHDACVPKLMITRR